MKFAVLVSCLERLEYDGKNYGQVLKKLWDHYGPADVFSLLRLLLPKFDRVRSTYGLKEGSLGQLLVSILGLSKTSTDGQRLIDWRNPHKTGGGSGNFADIVHDVLQHRCTDSSKLSVSDVNSLLDDLAAAADSSGRQKVMTQVVTRATAKEMKWITKIILKDLHVGVSEKKVLPSLHKDAFQLFNVCFDLSKVAKSVEDARKNPNMEMLSLISDIQLFNPVRPMLAAVSQPDEVMVKFRGAKFFLETKFDGERIQIHKQGSTVRLYSRSAKEWTEMYQKIIPSVLQCVACNKCILDGELVVWNKALSCFEEFGSLKTVALQGRGNDVEGFRNRKVMTSYDPDRQLCYIVFDILMREDEVLLRRPLHERHGVLKEIIQSKDKEFQLVESKVGHSEQDVVDYLDIALRNREEGVMIKNADSIYKPTDRTMWLKLKPDYLLGVPDTLDVLIIGGSYGSGNRGGKIWEYLLAVCEAPPPGQAPSIFYSFCKVGTGLKWAEFTELAAELEPHWRKFDKDNPPSHLRLTGDPKERPHVWVEPKRSLLLEVKGDVRFIMSSVFASSHSLRFPRIVRVRRDKAWHECMTRDELSECVSRSLQGGYHTTKRAAAVLAGSGPSPKKAKVAKVARLAGVIQHRRDTDVSDVKTQSWLFVGCDFCILQGSDTDTTYSKAALERLVCMHGGKKTQNYVANSTTHIIAGHKSARIATTYHNKDVIHFQWVVDCVEAGSLVPLEPRYMLNTSPETKEFFTHEIDSSGDSFSRDVTVAALKQIMSSDEMQANVERGADSSELASVSEYLTSGHSWAVLRNKKAFICREPTESSSRNAEPFVDGDALLLAARLRSLGAMVTTSHTAADLIVVLPPNARYPNTHSVPSCSAARVVGVSWVEECEKTKALPSR